MIINDHNCKWWDSIWIQYWAINRFSQVSLLSSLQFICSSHLCIYVSLYYQSSCLHTCISPSPCLVSLWPFLLVYLSYCFFMYCHLVSLCLRLIVSLFLFQTQCHWKLHMLSCLCDLCKHSCVYKLFFYVWGGGVLLIRNGERMYVCICISTWAILTITIIAPYGCCKQRHGISNALLSTNGPRHGQGSD